MDRHAACAAPEDLYLHRRLRQLYVACSGSDEIVVLDLGIGAVVARVPAGPGPQAFEVDRAGRLWIASAGRTTVAVIDAESGEVLSRVPVGSQPGGLALSPDDRTIYVTTASPAAVHVIDTSRRAVLGDYRIGTGPKHLALAPDGRDLWIASARAATLHVIDVERMLPVGTVTLAAPGSSAAQTELAGLAFNRDGSRLVVALGGTDYVALVDPRLREVLEYVAVNGKPTEIAVLEDGRVALVANREGGTVTAVDIVDGQRLATAAVGDGPSAIVVDR